ncbi:hypothetical protein [Williamsia sp. R60]
MPPIPATTWWDPRWEYTHAVDVAASPDHIWPWLVQIGQSRGGSEGSPDPSLWAFHIVDAGGGHSRLIERAYGRGLGSRLAFSPLFLEPISFVMSRKMLVTIAALAADRECNR